MPRYSYEQCSTRLLKILLKRCNMDMHARGFNDISALSLGRWILENQPNYHIWYFKKY